MPSVSIVRPVGTWAVLLRARSNVECKLIWRRQLSVYKAEQECDGCIGPAERSKFRPYWPARIKGFIDPTNPMDKKTNTGDAATNTFNLSYHRRDAFAQGAIKARLAASHRHKSSLLNRVPPHQRSIGLCRLKSSVPAKMASPSGVSFSSLRKYRSCR